MMKTAHILVRLKKFSSDESGATAIEYAFVAALISIVSVAAFRGMGDSLSNLFTAFSGHITDATNSI